jgi:hypothetical protein
MVMMVTWPLAIGDVGDDPALSSMRATLRLGGFLIPIGAAFLLFLKPGTTLIPAARTGADGLRHGAARTSPP